MILRWWLCISRCRCIRVMNLFFLMPNMIPCFFFPLLFGNVITLRWNNIVTVFKNLNIITLDQMLSTVAIDHLCTMEANPTTVSEPTLANTEVSGQNPPVCPVLLATLVKLGTTMSTSASWQNIKRNVRRKDTSVTRVISLPVANVSNMNEYILYVNIRQYNKMRHCIKHGFMF